LPNDEAWSRPAAGAPRCRGKHWLATWSTSPSDGRGIALQDQTVRLIVNPTLGGTRGPRDGGVISFVPQR
jgi:hypothetical protein